MKLKASPARHGITRSSTGCCASWGPSGTRRPDGCGRSAPRASSRPGELVDRYQLHCRPVRDLIVDYLAERQPAMDYTSLKNLAYYLAQRFWADLEHHHPGIDSLHLPREVAAAWKQRQRTKPQIDHFADRREVRHHGRARRLPPVPDPGPGLLPRPGPVGDRGPGPVGTMGGSLPGRPGRDQPAQVRSATAKPGWTSGPGNGCRSCPYWSGPSTSGARTPPRACRPPARPRPGRHSPPRARR